MTLIQLKLKSIFRNPLFYQSVPVSVFMVLLIFFYLLLLSVLGFVYSKNGLFDFLNEKSLNQQLSFYLSGFLLIDILLKFLFQKNNFFYFSLKRFPNYQAKIIRYYVVSLFLNLWNFYLFFFFVSFLLGKKANLDSYFFLIPILCFQILVSQFLVWIKQVGFKISVKCFYFFLFILILSINLLGYFQVLNSYTIILFFVIVLNFILAKSNINLLNYPEVLVTTKSSSFINFDSILSEKYPFFFLNLVSVARSPVLRKQFITGILLLGFYLYHLNNKGGVFDSFFVKMSVLSVCFSILPISLNQYIFTAHSPFFEKILLTPLFKKYLEVVYLQYCILSFIVFVVFLFFGLGNFTILEMFSAFIFSSGFIVLMSFVSVLVPNKRFNVFESNFNYWSSPPAAQSAVVIIVAFLSLGLVFCIFKMIKDEFYVLICMLILGVLSHVFATQWFNFLYKVFNKRKYKILENFRIK